MKLIRLVAIGPFAIMPPSVLKSPFGYKSGAAGDCANRDQTRHAIQQAVNPLVPSKDRFVSPLSDDLGGANDCTSMNQPCKTIQQAVNKAVPVDLIKLAPGTYFENVTVDKGVTIQGDLISGSIVNGGDVGPVFAVAKGAGLILSDLTITNGNAQATTGNPGANGGGIFIKDGELILINCTISGNRAAGSGGGIFGFGKLTAINSTISGNQAAVMGGGILNEDEATLVNTTVNGNQADSGGGIFNRFKAILSFTNTIVGGSTGGGDCVNEGIIAINDKNLIQDGTCGPALSGDPKLGPLQNNGGPTFTHALLIGSPAFDAGDDSVLAPFHLATDQRGAGFPRLACKHVDIGAFEVGAPVVTCPADVATVTDPGKTTATVSFSVTATDQCDGAITPACTIGGTAITSPFSFPVGATTVVCSAINSQGLTGTCSFTVTVTLLDECIQDDITHDSFRFNSQTGAYAYTRCRDKFVLTGTGTVRIIGSTISLTDFRGDRRISAILSSAQLTGRANLTLLVTPGAYQTITVNQTDTRATCTCP